MDLIKEVTFMQRLEGVKGVSLVFIRRKRKSESCRETNQYKGPELGAHLVCSRSSEEAGGSGVKDWIEKITGNKVKERLL